MSVSANVSIKASTPVSLSAKLQSGELQKAISAIASLGVSANVQLSGPVSQVISIINQLGSNADKISAIVSIRGKAKGSQ